MVRTVRGTNGSRLGTIKCIAGPRDETLMRDHGDQAEEFTRPRRTEPIFPRSNRLGSLWWQPSGFWLLAALCAEAGIALSILPQVVFGDELHGGRAFVPALAGLLLVPLVLHAAWRVVRHQQNQWARATDAARLMDAVLGTCSEWLWAIGADGRFTYSSPRSRELLGYEPSELFGKHWSTVMDLGAVGTLRSGRRHADGTEGRWIGPVAIRHRDGTTVRVEACVTACLGGAGSNVGYAGSARPLDHKTVDGSAAEKVRERIHALLANRTIETAFQPIRRLDSCHVVGVEALARFTGPPIQSPESWFADAASVGCGPELEFLAMEMALDAAARLPSHLYVSVNLSPQACLDPRLSDILRKSPVQLERIVLEVTERTAVDDYGHLRKALARARESGLRIAVDDACAGFASMHHILRLEPELIKLDRRIVAGIDANHGQRTLGAAMVQFATGTGAALIAEGIETEAELATVTELGINGGQGYLLGQPSAHPEEWRKWQYRGSRADDPCFQALGPGRV